MLARAFLQTKIVALTARARRLTRMDYDSVGIRPQDMPFAPSPAHFQAANQRLAARTSGWRRSIARSSAASNTCDGFGGVRRSTGS